MGAHLLSGGERDHPADDRLARQHVRTQTAADAVGGRLHAVEVPVWSRADAGTADCVPHFSGRDGGRAAAAVAGRPARGLSAARPWESDGILGPGDRRRPDPGPLPGGLLADQYQLGWGVLGNI